MSKGFNYSKWDKKELSDDEGDVHPNIDKDSWFRMKHRTRLDREANEDEDVKKMKTKNSEDQCRLSIINAKLSGLTHSKEDEDSEFEDIDALKDEAREISFNIDTRMKKIEEITERRKWNIDNICKVKDEKTIVNSSQIASLKAEDFVPNGLTEASFAKETEATIKKDKMNDSLHNPPLPIADVTSTSSMATVTTTLAAPIAQKSHEKFAMMAYNDFALLHEKLLEQYSEVEDMERTSKLLFAHCDVLLHEHAQSYLLLACLEDAMNNKMSRLKLVCRQSQILSHITELGLKFSVGFNFFTL
jgi:cell division cycle protein 37